MCPVFPHPALGPMKPAAQMVRDGGEFLTEAERLQVAFDWINQAEQTASIVMLGRLAGVAAATITELQATRMIDEIGADCSIDPDFMAIFLGYYDRPNRPSLSMAYRHAVMDAKQNNFAGHIAAKSTVQHALKSYRTGYRGVAS